MNRIVPPALVLLGLALSVGAAVGQQPARLAPLLPGEQIRLTTDSSESLAGYVPAPLHWRHGALDSIDGTHLWMRTRDGHLSVPLDMVKTLQVRRERRSAASVLASGTLARAALGALAAWAYPYVGWGAAFETMVAPFAALGFGLSLAMLPTMTEGWQSVPIGAANAHPPFPVP